MLRKNKEGHLYYIRELAEEIAELKLPIDADWAAVHSEKLRRYRCEELGLPQDTKIEDIIAHRVDTWWRKQCK